MGRLLGAPPDLDSGLNREGVVQGSWHQGLYCCVELGSGNQDAKTVVRVTRAGCSGGASHLAAESIFGLFGQKFRWRQCGALGVIMGHVTGSPGKVAFALVSVQ